MSDAAAPSAKVLVVDDTPTNLLAMRRILSRLPLELVEAKSGNEALVACLEHDFALILLDVQMPDMDGYEVATLLRQNEQTQETPVIFVTAAYSDELSRLRGYGTGAVDFITKPVNDDILLSKVRVFLELHAARLQLQALLKLLDEKNQALERAVAESQTAETKAKYQATHDALTGVPNRCLFMDHLQSGLERSRRRNSTLALFYVDIDGFKAVNDQHGHSAGDVLLRAITGRMNETMRKVDTVARLGGDEFAVIMEEPANPEHALQAAQRLGQRLAEPYQLEDPTLPVALTVRVSASIGVALSSTDADTADALVLAADNAMYRAKHAGKNRCVRAGEP